MKIRRDALDKLFSRYIRERDGWVCQKCGQWYQKGSQGLQCSHFIGRRNMAVRFYPANACAHCFACHMYLTANPLFFAEWIKEYLGEPAYTALKERAQWLPRYREADLRAIQADLRAKLAELERRAA